MNSIVRLGTNALIFAVMASSGIGQDVSKDLLGLAEAERSFARETVKLGFRDGFIRFFADDGIGFGPHPERTKEVLMKRPVETRPRTLIFNWAPMFGDISAAGDLGYTTGPVLFTPQGTDAKPPWHGIYFSVWERQADGGWKVAIDMGVDTPDAVAPIDTTFSAAKPIQRKTDHRFPVVTTGDLRALDAAFSESIAHIGMAKTYGKFLDRSEFRVHRKGRMPIVGENGLANVLNTGDVLEFLGGKVSSSNDLAFTYGKYSAAVDGSKTETGYYVHVWRRDSGGNWRVVADVQNPLPAK